VPVYRDGLFQSPQNSARCHHGRCGVGTREHDGKLVATESCHGVGGPHNTVQVPGDLLQEQVAVVVPEGGIDLFEPIEIQQQ
jgi:hypothetical protein